MTKRLNPSRGKSGRLVRIRKIKMTKEILNKLIRIFKRTGRVILIKLTSINKDNLHLKSTKESTI